MSIHTGWKDKTPEANLPGNKHEKYPTVEDYGPGFEKRVENAESCFSRGVKILFIVAVVGWLIFWLVARYYGLHLL